jgi:predicted branched-subunit amino acid permease
MTPANETPPPRRPFWDGVVVTLPVQIASFPFAVVSGVTAVGIGLDPLSAMAPSLFMYAGASQLVALQLLSMGAAALVIIASACVVNLRYFLYSASLAPHYRSMPLRWKVLLAHLLTDQGVALMVTRFNPAWSERDKIRFSLGSGLSMWVSWQIGTGLGVLLGKGVPPEWSLDFAVPLTFLALAVPGLRDRAAVAAFFTAGTIATACYAVPLNLGLLTAAIAGVAIGMFVEARE